jgi:neutral ceramidase
VVRHAKLLLATIDRDGKLPDQYPYPLQVWRFGKDLTLIVMGGEVVVDYALRFKARYGWETTWVAGYSNDVFAYIPSLRILNEGGYEGADAMIPYGQPGPFRPTVEEIVAEKVDDLMRATDPAK